MLTLDDAMALCRAAHHAADELGVSMTFAVMDAGGYERLG
jgi:uncharacterized protein GlcG (DUF336 family)